MWRTLGCGLLLTAIALTGTSCRSGAATGTAVGALMGAGMGTAIDSGHGWGGAAVGAAVGAGLGYAIGDIHDDRKREAQLRAARRAARTRRPVAYRVDDPESGGPWRVEARPTSRYEPGGRRRVHTRVQRWDPERGRWVTVDESAMIVD